MAFSDGLARVWSRAGGICPPPLNVIYSETQTVLLLKSITLTRWADFFKLLSISDSMARMFIGHYAVGLAAKKFAPRTSLGVLIAPPILLDLLWPTFLLLGWQHVSIAPNTHPSLQLPSPSY